MDVRDCFIYSRTLPARSAQYVPFPDSFPGELAACLEQMGIDRLYTHQAQMYEEAMQGKDLVITTSTASGKTLSFLLPVISRILEEPQTRAIFLYPTKALAADQMRAMRPILEHFGKDRICAGVYDGDTPVNERSHLRREANILLTNPEMLGGSFLPNHSRYGFDFIFSNLKFVVIDELHTCRGVFGSHVANLMRRLSRVLKYYGSKPVFLCSSATIANPLELAKEICGREFTQIKKDGSPMGERTYTLVQPPRIEDADKGYAGQLSAQSVTAQLLPELMEEGHNFIAFARSRRAVEVILRETRDRIRAQGFLGTSDESLVAGYRGGYTPRERKKIEKDMTSGKLKGLIATNALELGIDIGRVDCAVLTGYPGTRASFWQQTGRAGRSKESSASYLVLESLPQDQYIAVNPRWLFEESCESAVVDKNNLLIELSHIRAAAAELALSLDDLALFPDLGEAIPVLMKIGELRSENGKYAWNGNAYPAGDFSMRTADTKRYKLMDQERHEMITEMDELQAFREIHEGAVYMHEGTHYQVLRLDLESRTAWAQRFEGNYYTMPGVETQVNVIRLRQTENFGITERSWGDVNVTDTVFMYKKLQFHNHQNLGYEKLETPLIREFDSEACMVTIPQEVVDAYRSLLQPDPSGSLTRNNHFDGMCHALANAARMVTMTEPGDIGVTMSSNVIGAGERQESPGGQVYLYIYDCYAGGLGYAQKAFEQMDLILDTAITLTQGCSCKDGCIACVGDHRLDRQVVLWGLKSLREKLPRPAGYKYIRYGERPVIKKQFSFASLPDHWDEFRQTVALTGDGFSSFLETVTAVRINRTELILMVDSPFMAGWVSQKENSRAIRNIISYYTDAPSNLTVTALADPELKQQALDRSKDLKDKLQRRYERSQDPQDPEEEM